NRSAHSSTLPVWQRKDAMRRTDNQSIFNTGNWASKWRVALDFRQGLFEGFFRTPCGSLRSRRQPPHPLLRPIRLIFTAPIDFSARRCERLRTPTPLRAERLRDLAIGIRCQSVRWSGVLRIIRGTAGALGSGVLNRGTAGALDRVAQIAERK